MYLSVLSVFPFETEPSQHQYDSHSQQDEEVVAHCGLPVHTANVMIFPTTRVQLHQDSALVVLVRKNAIDEKE
jgi:hypothetical protein